MIGQVYAPAALASGTHEVGDRCCRAFWTWWRDGKSETGGNLGSSLGYKRLLIRVLRTFQNSFYQCTAAFRSRVLGIIHWCAAEVCFGKILINKGAQTNMSLDCRRNM